MATNEGTIVEMLKVVDVWNELTQRLTELRLSIYTLSPKEVENRIKFLEEIMENNRGAKNSLAAHIGQQKRQLVNPLRE